MSYKRLVPFINAENEISSHVISQAKKYVESGADELFVFRFAKSEIERDAFLSLLKQLVDSVDIPITAGIYFKKVEDAKKAFYTGVSKISIQNKLLDDYDAFNEAIARFGADNIYLEMDEREFMDGTYNAKQFIVKHLSLSDEFKEKVDSLDCSIMLRDSLRKNSLYDLFSIDKVHAVSTNSLLDKNLMDIKNNLADQGIDMNVFRSSLTFADFKKNADGLVPTVVQDYKTDEVLMVAYMNEEAYEKTLSTGLMHYFSRSRSELWCKGETSGNLQHVMKLSIDCDKDTLLAKVKQDGAACHTGNRSCFYTDLMVKNYDSSNPLKVFQDVYNIIADRKINRREGSYTNYLFDKGIDKILKKCGEEATEMVIAAKNINPSELTYEISDLLYHMMVLMVERGLTWDDITKELSNR